MQLAITNLSTVNTLELPYLELSIRPSATVTLSCTQSELSRMVDLQAAVANGSASYQVAPTAIETASGMLTVGVPVSTTSSAGLQSAQDKRSIQSYEPAKYLVIPPVGTWNPAVTSSAELSGCTTLVAGERAVLAGAGGGIYIADSATAMHLDDSFTGVKGYSVVVTEVAGQPTYRWDGTAFALATGGGSSGTGDYQVQYVANNIVTSLATYYSSLVSPQT